MGAETDTGSEGLAWQVGVWDRISPIYLREVDKRFSPVVEHVISRAGLRQGQRVLDVGTGTGAVAIGSSRLIVPGGQVVGIDISPQMLALGRQHTAELGLDNVVFQEGRVEEIPAEDGVFDVLLASLSLMYAIDRSAAAREIARVLRLGGRFVAAAWAGPEHADIVLFQQTAGRFAPPPVPGVGPGALADPAPFLTQLRDAGIDAHIETETLGFDFDDFDSAWDVLAGVTTAHLAAEQEDAAKAAVKAAMWPDARRPRHFRNVTQFIVGQRTARPIA